jgi:hypothetical protein
MGAQDRFVKTNWTPSDRSSCQDRRLAADRSQDRTALRLIDAEFVTRAVPQGPLAVRSEARWLRFMPRHLPGAFAYLPEQSGYNRLKLAASPMILPPTDERWRPELDVMTADGSGQWR